MANKKKTHNTAKTRKKATVKMKTTKTSIRKHVKVTVKKDVKALLAKKVKIKAPMKLKVKTAVKVMTKKRSFFGCRERNAVQSMAKKLKIKKPSKAELEMEAKRAEEEAMKLRRQEEQKRMQKIVKILSDAGVRQNLIGIGGENALAMVRSFQGNNSDEDLAKKLKIKISDVRATLNKLHNEGLVNYIREKASETGWYSYSWSLNHDRIEKWAGIQAARIGLNSDSDYYFCPACGTSSITNFESAAGVDFRCDRCNRLLEFIDEKRLNDLYEKVKV